MRGLALWSAFAVEERSMSDNPLESSPERDAAIKARAEAMWKAAGSPDGRMDEFTERADELVRMEMAGNPGQLPIETRPMVEDAAIQENLGEFPGQQQDQGDRLTSPMTRDEMHETMGESGDPNEPAAVVTGERINTKAS